MNKIYFSKERFDTAGNEILNDIEEGKVRSKSWIWLTGGAFMGFLLSCFRYGGKKVKPILIRMNKNEKGYEENYTDINRRF